MHYDFNHMQHILSCQPVLFLCPTACASDPGLMAQAGAAVSYPGLPSHPQHTLLQRLANPGYGFGGLLTLARSPAFSSPLPGMCRLACSLAVTADAQLQGTPHLFLSAQLRLAELAACAGETGRLHTCTP